MNRISNPWHSSRFFLYYSRMLRYVGRKPRTREEAQEHLDRVMPGGNLKIHWGSKEIGPWRWSGSIYSPILDREFTCHDTEGYDFAHFLMTWVFSQRHEGSGGIATNVYGCIGRPISYRQFLRLANDTGASASPGRSRIRGQFRAALKAWESTNR